MSVRVIISTYKTFIFKSLGNTWKMTHFDVNM